MVKALTSAGADVRIIRSREHDLRDAAAAREALNGADVVVHLAARVGGIGFNSRNAGVVAHDNLAIGANPPASDLWRDPQRSGLGRSASHLGRLEPR